MNEGRAERFKSIRERVHRHNQQIFEPALGLAVEIARERCEVRRIGTLFTSVDATVRYGGVSALSIDLNRPQFYLLASFILSLTRATRRDYHLSPATSQHH